MNNMDEVIRDLTGVIEGDLAAVNREKWALLVRKHRATEHIRKLSDVFRSFVVRRFRKAFRGLLSPKKPKVRVWLQYWSTGHLIQWGKNPKANPWVCVTADVQGLGIGSFKVECKLVPTNAAEVGRVADQMRAAVDAIIAGQEDR